jgi:hypothetical protein
MEFLLVMELLLLHLDMELLALVMDQVLVIALDMGNIQADKEEKILLHLGEETVKLINVKSPQKLKGINVVNLLTK